jgi:single-stranded-DNA-specific exonuclease
LPAADLAQLPPLTVDCAVTVADLGRDLFRALKRLEPYGMGNPIPRLLLKDVQITNLWEAALKDRRGGKQRYHKLSFDIVDPLTEVGFPGHWWGHRRADLPEGRYDLVVELDVNTYKKRYEARLIDLCPIATPGSTDVPSKTQWLIDQREHSLDSVSPPAMIACPTDWSDFSPYRVSKDSLTLAYPPPPPLSPEAQWHQLLGIVKYLVRTGESRPIALLQEKLGFSDRALPMAFSALETLGYTVHRQHEQVSFTASAKVPTGTQYEQTAHRFFTAVQEEYFRQQYFYAVPIDILEQVLGAMPTSASVSD